MQEARELARLLAGARPPAVTLLPVVDALTPAARAAYAARHAELAQTTVAAQLRVLCELQLDGRLRVRDTASPQTQVVPFMLTNGKQRARYDQALNALLTHLASELLRVAAGSTSSAAELSAIFASYDSVALCKRAEQTYVTLQLREPVPAQLPAVCDPLVARAVVGVFMLLARGTDPVQQLRVVHDLAVKLPTMVASKKQPLAFAGTATAESFAAAVRQSAVIRRLADRATMQRLEARLPPLVGNSAAIQTHRAKLLPAVRTATRIGGNERVRDAVLDLCVELHCTPQHEQTPELDAFAAATDDWLA
jgi:hypothetical protein